MQNLQKKPEILTRVSPINTSPAPVVNHFRYLFPILLTGAALRLYFLFQGRFVIDADEAIVGLMAKHITEGAPWPIFYYGQAYMGSFEAICTALFFKLFGRSNFTLQLTPFLFSLVLIVLIYNLTRRFTDIWGARVAAFLSAVAPNALIIWSTKARGGFIELVVIGTAALIVAVDLLREEDPRAKNFIVLGALLGFGWWVNNQIIFFIAPIGLVFLFHFLQKWGVKRAFLHGLLTAGAFFIGGFPFWYANLFQEPRFSSFILLSQRAKLKDAFEHLFKFFSESLPILFGARNFWSTTDLLPGLTIFSALLVLTVVVTVIKLYGLETSKGTRTPLLMLLLFCVTMPIIFSASQYGWLTQAPRYLLPLYSVYFVFIGISTFYLRRTFPKGGTTASFLIVALFAGVHLNSNFASEGGVPGEPFVFGGERVSRDHQELYSWLKQENYSHIQTNYWIGYRVAFETNEEVTFSIFRGPKQVRISRYEQLKPKYYEDSVLVLVPKEALLVQQGLSELGYKFRKTGVGGYVVIDKITPEWKRGGRLSISKDQLQVSSGDSTAAQMVDSDSGSRWGTASPQRPGMKVEIAFNQKVTLSALTLDFGFWRSDLPRALLIEAKGVDGKWCVLLNKQHNAALDYVLEDDRTWNLFFLPKAVSAIRLTQLGENEVFDWSIAELKLYQADNKNSAQTIDIEREE